MTVRIIPYERDPWGLASVVRPVTARKQRDAVALFASQRFSQDFEVGVADAPANEQGNDDR